MLRLQQENQSVAEFIIDFCTSAAEVNWPDWALQSIFRCALSEELKDQLASRDDPRTFEDLVSLSLRTDNRLREREAEKTPSVRKPAFSPQSLPSPPLLATTSAAGSASMDATAEPMQIGRSHLTAEER